MLSARIFLLTAAAAALAATFGCASEYGNDAATRAAAPPARTEPVTPPSTQIMTHTGTLRGGMMAIGGETSGWTLVGDGGVGGIELDVSQVQDAATRLDGKRVNVSGRMIDKRYVERGTVRTMRVEKIEESN